MDTESVNLPLVYIIILSWNSMRWIKACLESVLSTNYENYRIVVVDNASRDGCPDYVMKNFPEVTLIRNNRNRGYAEGNNIGIRYALEEGADYVAILNPDVKVDPGWLRPLVEVGEQDERLGILTPIHYDYEGQGIDVHFLDILNANQDYVRDADSGKFNSHYSISKVIGAAFLIRRQVCTKVGLFDPLYFAYFEEADFSRRALYHGFNIVAVPTSRIYHYHAALYKEEMAKKGKAILFRILRNHFIYELKDPTNNFVSNVTRYVKWRGSKVINRLGSIRDPMYLIKIIYIHAWLLLVMPLLAYKHYKERQGACYL